MREVKMILTNSFKADIRVFKEAKSLVESGYSVEILCWDRENELLNKEEEIKEGIKIKRFFPYSKYGTGKKQVIPFLKFYKEVNKYLINKKMDIIHSHDLDGLIIGFLLKKNNQKLIYDTHEFFSGYKTVTINKKIMWLEKLLLKKVDAIISVSESICNEIKRNCKTLLSPVVIKNVPYFKKIEEKNDLFRCEFKISKNKKILLYQGVFASNRGLEDLIYILKDLNEDIVLIFMGKGALKDRLINLAEREGVLNRVYFKEFVENNKLLNYTNSADIGIYFIQNTCLNHYYCLPNKIFEFIQGELPIVCSNFPDISSVIKNNNIGEVANPCDIKEIKEKIELIFLDLDKYKKNIHKVKECYSWEVEEKKILELYRNL